MSKKTIAILVILTFFFPFLLWNLVNCAKGYIPPTESFKKTPVQFESAFNEQMAKYGMYIDIDSVNFTYGDSLYKNFRSFARTEARSPVRIIRPVYEEKH